MARRSSARLWWERPDAREIHPRASNPQWLQRCTRRRPPASHGGCEQVARLAVTSGWDRASAAEGVPRTTRCAICERLRLHPAVPEWTLAAQEKQVREEAAARRLAGAARAAGLLRSRRDGDRL